MTAKYFVDTNVLIYARDAGQASKHGRALAWLECLWRMRAGRLSYQVLQEYYQVVTRRLKPAMDGHRAQEDIRDLMAWKPLPVDLSVLERAWTIEARYGFSWWDSLIVGAALQAECDYLLTEDLQHGQDLHGMQVLDPFQADLPS